MIRLRIVAAVTAALAGLAAARAQDADATDVRVGWNDQRQVVIFMNRDPFATYVYADPVITRPYFANIHAPGGARATRNQPPVAGEDLVDHPTFHPGLWLAFGDLSGADGWRLAAPVRHVEFVGRLTSGHHGVGSFAVRYSYREQENVDAEICQELFRCEIRVTPAGYLIVWDSTFTSNREFYFGDQEEMGLGLRIATPLRAQRAEEAGVSGGSGTIRDAEGRRNEAGVWGHSASWCDYSGLVDDQRIGMTIFCHPQNFRPSRFHARDRGLLVANPFGRAAFRQGEPSRVVVKPGESLRLRYGVLVHASAADESLDLDAAYGEYVELTSEN